MARAPITISGKVTDLNQKPIESLKVEAWDKDLLVNDSIGSSTTDADGKFSISFTLTYYKKLFNDKNPDLYFKIYEEGRLIHDTKESVTWNLKNDKELSIAFHYNSKVEENKLTINGKLVQSDGTAIVEATIKVLNKNLRSEDLLGETNTNEKGSFEIILDSTEPKDIVVRAYENNSEVASSDTYFNLSKDKYIQLVVGNKEYKGPSESIQLTEKATQKLEGLKLSSLTSDEISLLSGKTGVTSKKLSAMSSAESLSDQTGISKDFFFGLINGGLNSDLSNLAIQPDKVLSNKIKSAAAKNEISETETDDTSIQNNIDKLRTAAAKKTLTANDDTTSMYNILASTKMNDTQKEKFLVTLYENSNNYTKTFDTLKEDKDFDSGLIDGVKTVFQIGALTANHSTIIKSIYQKLNDTTSLSSFSLYSKDDWKTFISENQTSFPSTVEGETDDEKLDNYAQTLMRNFEKEFPGEKVKGKILADNPDDNVKKFFENASDFDISKTNINTYFKRNETSLKEKGVDIDASKKELKTYQRLYRIVPDEDKYDKIKVLKNNNFDSSSKIVSKYTNNGFKKKFGESLGSESIAENIFSNAQNMMLGATAVAGMITDDVASVSPLVIQNSEEKRKKKDTKSYEIEIPDWKTLFGSTSYCKCEYCRSVLSPAAYLVDLLEFINRDPNDDGMTPCDLLLERRPDIGNILLSCQNTNTALPYIDLVIEVLENGVALLNKRSTTYIYQTTGTTEELQAMPEHINADAYKILSEDVYPFMLPFHFWNKEADAYIEKLGFKRYEVLRTLQYVGGSNEPTDLSVALVYLGLSENQKKVIAGDDSIIVNLVKNTGEPYESSKDFDSWDFYGADEGWDSTRNNVETFLKLTGISYDELLKLLQVNFLNPDGNISIEFDSSSECDISKANLINTENSFFKRTHRFLRLIKVLGWDILDLGKFIDATGESDFNDNFFIKLFTAKYLKEKLGKDLVELLSWWSTINTDIDLNDSESRSYYDLLFQNKAVTNPVEEVFKLSSDKTKLDIETLTNAGDYFISNYLSSIAAACNVSTSDLSQILDYLGLGSANLTFQNLCKIHRHASGAKAFGLEISELLILIDFLPVNPFKNLAGDPIKFYENVSKIKDSDFSILELDYLFTHRFEADDNICPSDDNIINILKTIQEELIKIKADSENITDSTGEITKSYLEQILGASTAQEIIDIIKGTSLFSELDNKVTIKSYLSFIVDTGFEESIDKVYLNLISSSAVVSEEELEAKYNYIVKPLNFYLLGVDYLAQELMSEFDTDVAASKSLITGLVKSPDDSSKFAASVFLNSSFLSHVFSDNENLSSDLSAQYKTYVKLHKALLVISRFGFTNEETKWAYEKGWTVGWLDLNNLDATGLFEPWRIMYEFSIINKNFRSEDLIFTDLLTEVFSSSTDVTSIKTKLSSLTSWNPDDIEYLASADAYNLKAEDFRNGQAFYKFYEIMQLTDKAGIFAEQLWSWSKTDLVEEDSENIKKASKSKYSTTEWLSVGPGLRNKLRPIQRDALTGYLIEKGDELRKKIYGEEDYEAKSYPIEDVNDLLDVFLIDVQMESDFLTARIKQACSSIQMFIQRSFMGLEVGVELNDEQKDQWEWMKFYRYWEANRKVFLYPENWLEPELRTTKTEIFEELESELLQDEINDENVERGLVRYLESLSNISNLIICSTYVDTPLSNLLGILYVFGRTQNDPYEYYFRTFDYELEYWSPWEKIDLDIDSPTITPIVHNGRLYLFWLTFKEKALSSVEFEKKFYGNEPLKDLFVTESYFIENLDNRDESFKYYEINIAYSIYKFDKWTAKKISTDFVSSDNFEAAVKYYAFDTNLEMSNFFIVNSKENDKLLLKIIENTGNAIVKLRKVVCEFPAPFGNVIDIEAIESEYEDYDVEFENGLIVIYETSEEDEFSIEEYNKIGEFCFDTDDSNLLITLKSEEQYTIDLPDDIVGWPNKAYTKYNMINGNLFGDPITNTDHGILWLTNSPLSIEILEKTPSAYLIPLPSQFDGVTYKDDFFYMDSDTEARYFVRYYTNATTSGNSSNTDPWHYRFISVYHPYIKDVLKEYLQTSDISTMFSRDLQTKFSSVWDFSQAYSPTEIVEQPYPYDQFDFDYGTPFYRYNWEFFYHIPMIIADYLSQEQRFEEAQEWYHFIFNPLDRSSINAPQKYWQLKPFYKETDLDSIYDLMLALNSGDEEVGSQLDAWKANPFEPHVIAELRISAYMKNTVMKYLDNLIAWGDNLFSIDTIETINEATQLYILALQILGDKPEEIPTTQTEDKTYYDMNGNLDEFSNYLVEEIETYITTVSIGWGITFPVPSISIYKDLYFCIPNNDNLLKYWDTIDDRLFKIRNSMNIEGVTRSLAIYEPAIDPALLISAKAAGIDLGTVLSDINSPLPSYRFRFFIQKAVQFCSDVQSLGNAFLSVLEKQNAEELSLLRASQELSLLQATKDLKKLQADEAEESYDALVKSKEIAEIRYNYYSEVEKISEKESQNLSYLDLSNTFSVLASSTDSLASTLYSIPDIELSATGIKTETGGIHWGHSVTSAATVLRMFANSYSNSAQKSSINAGYDRRWDDWKLQEDLATKEMEQYDKQIAAAEVRKAIAEKDLENTELQIEQSKEVYEWMTGKYTNEELYKWMSTQISKLYFQSYQLAYDCAKRAQRAFQYELNSSQTFIQYGYWDSLKKGLLAGEKLLYDLKRMEMSYYEQNKRQFEITKNISLALLDPSALIMLRKTGECFVTLPEAIFDLDYPGHYQRRIKSVALTIPCVTGPYTNLNCTLTLLENKFRKDPSTSSEYKEKDGSTDTRFAYNLCAIQSIATSSGRNDSGVFQLNFEDERYLPFEGAGAISKWRLRLPNEFRSFDYDTISDIIFHLSYTSKDGGETLRNDATTCLQDSLSDGTTINNKLFSAKYEFPNEWYQMSVNGNTITFKIEKENFPYIFYLKTISLASFNIFVLLKTGTDEDLTANSVKLKTWNNLNNVKNGILDVSSIVFSSDTSISITDSAGGSIINNIDDILFLFSYTVSSVS